MIKKVNFGLIGALILGMVVFASAWDSAGNIDHIFISDAGPVPAYSTTTPKCLVHLTDGKYFIFSLNNDIGKAWLADVLSARANGSVVTVAYNGLDSGYNKALVVWIQ